ncbi:hypothetical protein PRIPAC_92482 [Pristionchus pacificus]|uniref:Uncharacterized protein n=1 Tax=Pristionchus pacificus TaxID=54126 RepID=A0A2A6CDU6_PRIPA|nr:hypothetical protein PRIPAC_92482 [Pristionchus pacificus]|eukprot:PDM76415.1 hypothetical protein PRIPAC_40019 [Pristionchus pacificus]
MQKAFVLCCLALATAYSMPKKEPKMPEIDDSADYGSPVANSWPLGRDPVPAELAQDDAIQKYPSVPYGNTLQQRETAQAKIEVILKAKMAAAAARTTASHTVPLAIVAQSDEPELRPLGFDLVLKAGDMVRRVQRFLNNYESEHQFASEEDWMIAFLDEMQAIDQDDSHILTDRLFTILKEKRTHHRNH